MASSLDHSIASNPGPNPTASTRERILDTAEDLFAKKGFAGVGLREIARGVGIQQPSLYRHFESKDALYEAVLQRGMQPVLEALNAFLEEEPAGSDVDDLSAYVMEVLARHPHIARLLIHEVTMGGGRINPAVEHTLAPLFHQAVRIISRASSGVLDEEEASLWMIAAFHTAAGYFSSQGILAMLGDMDPASPRMRKKQMRVMRGLKDAIALRMAESSPSPSSRKGNRQ